MTILGLKKPIVLVDAPANTIVSRDGEILEIQDVTAFRDEQSSGNTNNVTLYKHPGVKIKLKKNVELEFQSGKTIGKTKIKTKPAIGMLIGEAFFTLGIGTIVDLLTGAYWVTKNRFIDVPAVLENKEPRPEKELKNKVRSSFR